MATQTNGTSLDFGTFSNVINGKLTSTTKTRHGVNPSTLEENPAVPVSTQKDVDDAVAAARQAQPSWAATPVEERRKALVAFADAVAAEKGQFSKMLTKEQGKPLSAAQMEVDMAVHWLKEQAKYDLPEEVIEDSATKLTVTRYTPIGVAVGIVPWNFPIQLACGKIAPALLAGNAIIIKPSPFTPYNGLKLVELGLKFFPPGVFQALSGDDNLGPWLTEHPDVDKISFTGSTMTGKLVMKSASKTLKRVTLELGGNDPAIVCGDVDIPSVAQQVAQFAFANSGQVCIAIKRIYVHSSIYDKFLAAVVEFTKSMTVGDGFKEDTALGPIQNEMQWKKVNALIDNIESQKLTIATGEKRFDGKGFFVNPTIIDNPADDERIVTDEPFGPVVPLLKWTDEKDVVSRANKTDMGLGASVWTNDMEQANRIAKQLQAGSVWVNTHMAVQPTAAFGGHKQSGLGSEWGKQGLTSYMNAQTLFLQKPKSSL